MLNKVRNNIISMLDTLEEALVQYMASPTEVFLGEIFDFMAAINAQLERETKEAVTLAQQLYKSLKELSISEVKNLYNGYRNAIESIPVQYKAVFLPYYDNTWDSLESIYEAFAADPVFVTEIVIIPIRRNTPSGWKIVYEDYLTPRGIPNTVFSRYSFKNDLPDFVFYSNPYDGVNIEQFQSNNIKPYAGCMIYVPYFLYRHQFFDREELKRFTGQFTELPGHNAADIIITQGKSFMKTFAHRSRNRKKMVALGNPKTDNIYKNKENYPRYPEWDKITEGKTVYMLNTHYRSVISGQYKRFLSLIFDFVDQNEDTALIWRPHPQSFLMVEKDVMSEMYLDWRDWTGRVSGHERMILDDTAISVSAIMYSDAVLSHNSSIVAEAVFADKPVFVWWTDKREFAAYEAGAYTDFEAYRQKVCQLQKYDISNIFMNDAVCYISLNPSITRKEDFNTRYLLPQFAVEIKNGIDRKKELRNLFRSQLFANPDGTCGQKIHDYVVGLINLSS